MKPNYMQQPELKIPSPGSLTPKESTKVKFAFRSMVKGDFMVFSKIGERVYSDWVTTLSQATLFDSTTDALFALQKRTASNPFEWFTSLKLVKVALTYRVSESITDL